MLPPLRARVAPAMQSAAEQQLRNANLDIIALKAELGIDDTPREDFEHFLEESNQLTPRAVRRAESEFKASEEELLQQVRPPRLRGPSACSTHRPQPPPATHCAV